MNLFTHLQVHRWSPTAWKWTGLICETVKDLHHPVHATQPSFYRRSQSDVCLRLSSRKQTVRVCLHFCSKRMINTPGLSIVLLTFSLKSRSYQLLSFRCQGQIGTWDSPVIVFKSLTLPICEQQRKKTDYRWLTLTNPAQTRAERSSHSAQLVKLAGNLSRS